MAIPPIMSHITTVNSAFRSRSQDWQRVVAASMDHNIGEGRHPGRASDPPSESKPLARGLVTACGPLLDAPARHGRGSEMMSTSWRAAFPSGLAVVMLLAVPMHA